MSLKDTWAKWEKEEQERKPETEYYQWVDKNGYVHDKEREIWHLSVYDFVVMLKSAFKVTIILYLAYIAVCLFFIMQGNKYMHIPTTLTETIGAILRLYIVVALVRCYKYVWRAVTTVLGIILLIGLTILICTVLFYSIRAIV